MDYNESNSNKKRKIGSGIYVLIAVALLATGVIAWFVMAGMSDESNISSNITPSVSESNEYNDNTPSYNETESGVISNITEPTADSVSSQPYASNETKESLNDVSFAMPVEGEIIKDFSDTALQYSSTFSDMRLHTGIDISCEKGTSVSACSDGEVTEISLNTSLGNIVTIKHNDGVVIKYCAIDNLKVEKGEQVKIGDIIGTSATVPEECNDKAHIHIEVFKDEKAINPSNILKFN